MQSEVPPELLDRPLPRQVRAVALVLVFIGWSSLFGMVLSLAHGRLHLDLTALAAIFGVGLLKRSERSRRWTNFLSVALLTIFLIGMAVAVFWMPDATFVTLADRRWRLVEPYQVALACLWIGLVLAVLLWIAIVTDRARRSGVFYMQSHPPPLDRHSRRQVIGAAIAAFGAAIGAHVLVLVIPPLEVSRHVTTLDGRRMWAITTGSRGNRLLFGVVQVGDHIRSGLGVGVAHGSKTDDAYAWIDLSDGSRIDLPGERQLYQMIDGELTWSDRQVTLEQWQAFIRSNPPDYRLETLFAFLGRRSM